MKFKETVLYKTLLIPVENWKNDCLYTFLLKTPYLLLLLIVGMPMAIICDIYFSMNSVKYD